MSTSQVLSIVGYVAGNAVLPGLGGSLGALAGGVLGSIIDPVQFDVPKVGDLKAPQMQYGSKLPRMYGSNRTSGTLAWYSAKRVIPGDSGGKGEPNPPTADTAEIDVLYILSVDSPIVAIPRIWRNGELIWTSHSGSSASSIGASGATEAWTSIDFLDGNPAQLPHPTIEAADGVGNVSAYRHRQCLLITGLQLGQSGQLPLMEFECVTHASTEVTTDLFADLPTPLGAYIGLGTPALSSAGFQVWVGQWDNSYLTNDCIVYDVAADGSHTQAAIVTLQSNVSSGLGNSDENGIMNASASPWEIAYWTWSLSGFYAHFILPTGAGMASGQRFSKVGDDFVFVCQQTGFGLKKVFRYTRENPALQAASVDLSTVPGCSGYCSSIAIGGSNVYALDTGGALIIRLDLSTLAVEATFATPSTNSGAAVVCDEDGDLYFSDSLTGLVSKWNGSTWSTEFIGIGTVIGSSVTCSYGFRGNSFMAIGGSAHGYAPSQHVYVRRAMSSVDPAPIMLDEIVSAEWARVADASQIDVTGLAEIPVRGFTAGGSVRGALEETAAIFRWGMVVSDKAYCRLMGGPAVATLTFDELGAGEEKAAEEPFAPEHANEEEIVERVLLTCPDYSNDYNTTTQSGNRGTGTSTIEQVSTTNVVMTPSECKGVAEVSAALAGISAMTGQVALTDYYAQLEPTDPILVPDEDGNTYRIRIVRDTYSRGVHQHEWVLDDTQALVSVGITSTAGGQALTVALPDVTQVLLVDTALWRDVDDDAGFYAVAKGSSHGSKLYNSLDNVTYEEIAAFTSQSVFGVCTTTLNDWSGGWVFDEVSSVTVSVGAGTLSSSTSLALIGDRSINVCAIGVHGSWELCQFRTATLISTGIYTLTGFLRGLNGTEWASTGHDSNESFAMVTTAARRVELPASEIGVSEYYKGVSAGRPLSSATAQTFVNSAVGKKPYAVVDMKKTISGALIGVSWHRRSRLSYRFLSTTELPLGEATESYDVELYDSGDVLVSTETVTEASWEGTASSIAGGLISPAWGIKTISGELVAIRDDQLGTYSTPKYLTRFDPSDGSLIAGSGVLAQEVYQWTNDGDQLYVATADFNNTTPTTYNNSKVQRLSRTSLGSVAATYTAAVPGDIWGVASDATNIWITERYSGNLRKLNETSLASVATYAVNVGITALYHDAGSLWIVSNDTSEVIEWDIGTTTELQRFSVVTAPFDLLIVGSQVFVQGAYSVGLYDMGTGALVNSVSVSAPNQLAQRTLSVFGSYVAVANIDDVKLLNSTTGVEERTVEPGTQYFFNVAGTDGTLLYLTTGAPGVSASTDGYELATADLSGYSLTVYQKSATVGRGYPATLEL